MCMSTKVPVFIPREDVEIETDEKALKPTDKGDGLQSDSQLLLKKVLRLLHQA